MPFFTANPVAADPTQLNINGLNVSFWEPQTRTRMATDKPPVIIFSHGLGGCGTQSTFLMEALAKDGYAVFAPDHADAQCDNPGKPLHAWQGEKPIRKPDVWDDKSAHNRQEDIAGLLHALETEAEYADTYDVTKIGLVGHSLGGYTMLGVAGGWQSWKLNDPNIKAVLALSPYAQPLLLHGTLDKINLPVMYQGGTLDSQMTPEIDKENGAYAKTPKPRYFVEFDGAGHLAWTDMRETQHDGIAAYSLAFLDHYVKGEAVSDVLLKPATGVSVLRYDTEEGTLEGPPHAKAEEKKKKSIMASPNGAAPSESTMRDRGMAPAPGHMMPQFHGSDR